MRLALQRPLHSLTSLAPLACCCVRKPIMGCAASSTKKKPGSGDPRQLSTSVDGLKYPSSCFFPDTWYEVPLMAKREYNHDSTVYTFELPEGKSLSLPVCACILMRAMGRGRKEGGGKDDWDGSDAVRPYTPMSDNSMLGQFELLIKRYPDAAASQWLHELPVGSMVGFKHIDKNIKLQYPFDGKQKISMLCAGTGITPMYQALHKLLGTAGDTREVKLLYGNKAPSDILMKEQLEQWAAASAGRLKVVHIVGDKPDDPPPAGWVSTPAYTAESGWIDEAKIVEHCHPPAEDTLLFVCGLPSMYAALCGPRTQQEVAAGTVLAKLGYTASMVSKL